MESPKLTPMMRQFHEIKASHPDKILFFRLGDFYEMFYDDALEGSRILQITLTHRQDTPMCGVPYHAANAYLRKLIAHGKKVAIVEQTGSDESKPGLFRREVVQIVTPGTVTDPESLDNGKNNFLSSWTPEAAAFLEVSTGEFHLFPFAQEKNVRDEQALESLLERFSPRECLVPQSHTEKSKLPNALAGRLVSPLPDHLFAVEYAWGKLTEFYELKSIASLFAAERPEKSAPKTGIGALHALIHYALETQRVPLSHIRLPRLHRAGASMWVDRLTQRNLELVANQYDHSEKHSLFWALKTTLTPMGTRRLREAILEPFLDLKKIEGRLDTVEYFAKHPAFHTSLREHLKQVGDFERICSRISTGRVLPRELVTFKNSLAAGVTLVEFLKTEKSFSFKIESDEVVPAAIEKITRTILPEPANSLSEGGFVVPSAHPDLEKYSKAKLEGARWIAELQEEEKSKSGLGALKIKFTDANGYFFELPKAQSKNAPSHFVRKQTLVTGERYTTEKLLELESLLKDASEKNNGLESEIYAALLTDLKTSIPSVQNLADLCAEIDLLASFAETAMKRRYVRPTFNNTHSLEIRGGRHPVIEQVIDTPFIPNDLVMNEKAGTLHIVTGPNMSGKSTFLRQSAIIVHLAQCGSFVPATSANLPLVDRVFTRIGASDHLSRGESTFMVEMTETAQILSQATSKSLILMDEIGRGTSTYDGLSLAWAIIEYLSEMSSVRPRTLFATHYHELTELERIPGVKNYHLHVQEDGQKLVFLNKIVDGPADDSYGIQVAELAGLPRLLTDRAKGILRELESSGNHHLKKGEPANANAAPPNGTPSSAMRQIESELSTLDLDHLTPFEALSLIADWKKNAAKQS